MGAEDKVLRGDESEEINLDLEALSSEEAEVVDAVTYMMTLTIEIENDHARVYIKYDIWIKDKDLLSVTRRFNNYNSIA